MKVQYQENVEVIPNCPSNNEEGDIELFRCVEDPVTFGSFLPQAVLVKPKYTDICEAWGLSTSKSLRHAKQLLKSLSKSKRVKYAQVAKMKVTNEDGVKYCGQNKAHYTFFPKAELNLVESFTIIETNVN